VRKLCILSVLLGACDDQVDLFTGDVRVELSEDRGLVIKRAGEVVLRSHRGDTTGADDPLRAGDAYAAFAAANNRRLRAEEQYGYFRFAQTVEEYDNFSLADIERKTPWHATFRVGEHGKGNVMLFGEGIVAITWSVPDNDRFAMTFACDPSERFFGMGAQVSSEHRGFRVPVWSAEQGNGKAERGEDNFLFGLTGEHYDAYAPVPFALSSRPYGLWVDTRHYVEMEFCEDDERLRVESWAPQMSLVVFANESMARSLQTFTGASWGRPAPVSRWTFAPWVDAFGGPTGIADVVEVLRDRDIPASAVWAEDWVGTTEALGGEHLTYNWEQDTTLYPDLGAVADDLHRAGLRFLTYVNPFVPNDTQLYQDLLAADGLVRDHRGEVVELSFAWGAPPGYFDPTSAGGQTVFREYMERALANGVDGWMADYGEALPYDAVLADGRTGAEGHNAYPILWAATNDAFLREQRPDDFAFFSRSGHTGIAAATHIHWLGDQLVSFDENDGLGSVVPLYLSAGLSGIALTHSDTGGYTSFLANVRTFELWARWLELEAFTPFLRMHHTSNPAANLQWHSDDATLALVEEYFDWHQRLLPYFARVAGEASSHGWPAVRPLWWGAEERDDLYLVDDAFLVGNDLLIAPIVTEGATERSVPLPPDAWRRWPALQAPLGAAETGTVQASATVEQAIVYVRAGAVVPLLAADYDTLAPTRAGDIIDADVDVAPDAIDELRLLIVGGGAHHGTLTGYTLPSLIWSWQGTDVAAGPLIEVRVAGEPLPACDSTTTVDCLDGAVARLSPAQLGSALTLVSAAGEGILTVSGTGVAALVIDLR